LAVTRKLVAACTIAGLYAPALVWAMPPVTAGLPWGSVVLAQARPEVAFAALDARLEAAAVTAALIRAYNVVVVLAEQNLGLMSVIAKLVPRDPDSPTVQQPGRQATQEKQAEIRGAMDTALESYLRLIGEIENSSSMEDVSARTEVVQRAMGFRGQGSIKAALPTILLHIKLIHAHAAPSRETIMKDLSALPTR
jgi:hypothetical protein